MIGVSLQKTESIECPLTCYFHIFCSQLISKTFISPTVRLEQHLMWDDIAILTRYLLMLSFNDCLDGRGLLLIKKKQLALPSSGQFSIEFTKQSRITLVSLYFVM